MRLGHLGTALWPLLALTLAGCAGTRATAPAPKATAPAARPAEPDEGPQLLTPPGLRLDASVRPVRQAVTLELDPRQETFRGTVDVELSLPEPTRVLWLHGEELEVKGAAFTVGAEREGALVLPLGDMLAVLPRRPLGPGTVLLRMEYTGRAIAREDSGVFREEEAGRWYAMTQFQALYARRAFPCFDEPSFKIPWQLTLRVPEADAAFSNTPVEAEERGADGWKTVRFRATPPLPTYLVAFAVGPFEVLDAGRAGKNRVPVRMVVPRGRVAEARQSALATPPLLEWLEAWFGTPYPYAKLDVLALPGGAQAGAMEHPGLITFGAQLMLGPEQGDAVWRPRMFAETQAHELAHQWFGNLVTPAWWDDLWLNESFADWLAYKAITAWKPEWRGDVRRVEVRGDALREDQLASARSIRQPIEAPADIDAAFDGITYGKGAGVLAMFESWVGPDVFQRGVRGFMDAHAGGTATTADFLRALSSAAGRDVAPAFASFLDQPGVPRVALELQCPAGAPPRLALAQRRYRALGTPEGGEAQRWQVPVCVRYAARGTEGRACTVLTEATGTLVLEDAKACPDWVHPNAEGRGYYHALLRGDGLERLSGHSGALSIPEHRVLLDDAQALVASGELDVAQALRLASRLVRADDPDLVAGAVSVVGGVREDFVPDALQPHRARFVRGLFGGLARRLGFVSRPGESEDHRMLRPLLVWLVANVGQDAALRAEARRLTLRWLEDRGLLPLDAAHAVLSTAAAGGDAALHQRLREALRATPWGHERELLIAALGTFQDPTLGRKSLELLLAPDVDAREALPILFGQLATASTREGAFTFVREHFEALRHRLPRDLAGWLLSAGGTFCDAEHRQQAAAFFGPRAREIEGGERALAQSLERVDLCIAQREALRPGLERFLVRY